MNVLCLDIVYFMAKEKARFFTFLLYPDGEGFPSDWEIRLELIGQPIAISPLHDQDKDKKNGDIKNGIIMGFMWLIIQLLLIV